MDRITFYKLLKCLEKRGYKEHLDMLPVMPCCKTSYDSLASKIFWQRRYEIIFSHAFAKALWGNKSRRHVLYGEIIDCGMGPLEYGPLYQPNWEYCLKQMVLKKDPFSYIQYYYTLEED